METTILFDPEDGDDSDYRSSLFRREEKRVSQEIVVLEGVSSLGLTPPT
jgi:hypothetical protein